MPPVRFQILTNPHSSGAIGVVRLTGEAPDLAAVLTLDLPAPGRFRLASILGIEDGVLARWGEGEIDLMFHGGHAVRRAIAHALSTRGATPRPLKPPTDIGDDLLRMEAWVGWALSIAASPLAVDLLLDQVERVRQGRAPMADPARLGHLVRPPLVVGIGPANVGKSSLLNALAGRTVAVTADEPGTTRDHVGVRLDLAGLVVRYVDTPGVRPDAGELEHRAAELAKPIIASADLVLSCFDLSADAVPAPADLDVMRVHLRRDLGRSTGRADVEVSVFEPGSVEAFASAVRERLVPGRVLEDPGVWALWEEEALQGPGF